MWDKMVVGRLVEPEAAFYTDEKKNSVEVLSKLMANDKPCQVVDLNLLDLALSLKCNAPYKFSRVLLFLLKRNTVQRKWTQISLVSCKRKFPVVEAMLLFRVPLFDPLGLPCGPGEQFCAAWFLNFLISSFCPWMIFCWPSIKRCIFFSHPGYSFKLQALVCWENRCQNEYTVMHQCKRFWMEVTGELVFQRIIRTIRMNT